MGLVELLGARPSEGHGQQCKTLYLPPSLMAKQPVPSDDTPAALGFSMPAEWEKHEATWLGWPHNPSDWPDKIDTIRWVYAEMVRRISPGERVRILVNNASEERRARQYLARAGCHLK